MQQGRQQIILNRLGNLKAAYLVGNFAKGLDSHLIDLILVGEVDRDYLIQLIAKMESMIKRKIRYIIYTEKEFESLEQSGQESEPLLIWAEKKADSDGK